MKKIMSLLLLLATAGISVSAQNSNTTRRTGFEPTIRAYYDLRDADYIDSSAGMNIVAAYRCSPKFLIGVGTGVEQSKMLYYQSSKYYSWETATLLPLFAELKLNFTDTPVSPYVLMDSGYSVTIVSAEETPGLFFRPTFGVDFRVGTGKLSLQTSYKVQHVNYKYFGTLSEDHISCNAGQVEVAISYSF
jgi:hypothetical protein